ncbi:transmembrane protein 26-like [Dreissena polymorpha]|uniref:Transmembrane protein 26 n=1 Tax=Dreissena polymorpha TaxID=45954 RepID=A0A9D4LNX9_DREPO|nr:transmembrane protein 26-like [Dreissena polymorpha]KAH3861289.1 hypothetical protein DPMN_024216 [Dreissena polymorpha]
MLRLVWGSAYKARHSVKVRPIFLAILVRCLLLLHNFLSVWRVVETRRDSRLWTLLAINVLLVIEAAFVIRINRGIEWKWWCPCFLFHLMTTLPCFWLLQISQYEHAIAVALEVQGLNDPHNEGLTEDASPLTIAVYTTTLRHSSTTANIPNTTSANILTHIDSILLGIGEQTWIVIIQETLVYLIIFGGWVLPRANTSKDELSSVLLEYLGMASDIMELFALFDEPRVQTNQHLTYAILTIWSISFLQFIPILKQHKGNKLLHIELLLNGKRSCNFAEVVSTCIKLLLQDLPFMCLRLTIIVHFQLVTYSLVFFVVKNIVTILLLVYRLTVLCNKLPCCYTEHAEEFDGVAIEGPTVADDSILNPSSKASQVVTSSLPTYGIKYFVSPLTSTTKADLHGGSASDKPSSKQHHWKTKRKSTSLPNVTKANMLTI